MKINIRQEAQEDYESVEKLIEYAFHLIEFSDHQEHLLVKRLRKSAAFIPELSLIALAQNEIVGHILLTKIKIENQEKSFPSLALAPVSVLPEFQRKGIGGQLIRAAHERAKRMGFQSIVLLGHEDYYPRFGYERMDKYSISLPFEAPPENCMILDLTGNGLVGVSGVVKYSSEFFE